MKNGERLIHALLTPSFDNSPAPDPVVSSLQDLPLETLDWSIFERLCARLLSRNSTVIDCRQFGIPGQDQEGIDLYAFHHDDSYSAWQCKRHKVLKKGIIKAATDQFLEGDWSSKVREFRFVITADLTPVQFVNEIEECRETLAAHGGIAFLPMGKREVSDALKEHYDLVAEFFGVHWAQAFCVSRSQPEVSFGRLKVNRSIQKEFVGREKELSKLNSYYECSPTDVVTIVADGGFGKTALVAEWLERLRSNGYECVQQGFDWSFSTRLSSGSESSIPFLQALETHFGRFGLRLEATNRQYPEIYGEQLAKFYLQLGGLLILDGIETQQYSPFANEGHLQDLALLGFLQRICNAKPSTNGHRLVVITTRWAIPTLDTVNCEQIELKRLDRDAGVSLLKGFGANSATLPQLHFQTSPTVAEDSGFESVVEQLHGHPLSLLLLASLATYRYNGDLRTCSELPRFLESKTEVAQGTINSILASYEEAFEDDSEIAAPGPSCLALLTLLSVFDREISVSFLKTLLRDDAPPFRQNDGEGLEIPIDRSIHNFPDELAVLTRGSFQIAFEELQRLQFIAVHPAKPHHVSAHACISSYFRNNFRKRYPEAYVQLHRRIAILLTHSAEHPADSRSAVEQHFIAMEHYIAAGDLRFALNRVFAFELQRGGEAFYVSNYLGMFERMLSVLVQLQSQRDIHIETDYGITGSAYVHNQLGVCYRALNRVDEAASEFAAARDDAIYWNDLEKVAADTCNLVDLFVQQAMPSKALNAIRTFEHAIGTVAEGFELEDDDAVLIHARVNLKFFEMVVRHFEGCLDQARELNEQARIEDRKIFDGKYTCKAPRWAINFHTDCSDHESDMGEGCIDIFYWQVLLDRSEYQDLIAQLCQWGHRATEGKRAENYSRTIDRPRNWLKYWTILSRALAIEARERGYILDKEHPSFEKEHHHFFWATRGNGSIEFSNLCQKHPLEYLRHAFSQLDEIYCQDLLPSLFYARASVRWAIRKIEGEAPGHAAYDLAMRDLEKAIYFASHGGLLAKECETRLLRLEVIVEAAADEIITLDRHQHEDLDVDARFIRQVVEGRHVLQGRGDGFGLLRQRLEKLVATMASMN